MAEEFHYVPRWQGPLSGRSFEKQTEDAINGLYEYIGEHGQPSDALPLAPGTASAGTSSLLSRGDHRHPAQTDISGNAGSAAKLQTERSIIVAGDASGSAPFDGSADATITLSIPDASQDAKGLMSAEDKAKLDGMSGEDYVLPEATAETLGGVYLESELDADSPNCVRNSAVAQGLAGKLDADGAYVKDISASGTTIYADMGDGTQKEVEIVVPEYVLPEATSETLGGVYVDEALDPESGNPVQNSAVAQAIDSVRYVLPEASAEELGGVYVDEEINAESPNPVQNSAVHEALAALSARIDEAEESLSGAVRLRGSVDTLEDLPADAEVGDTYNVGPTLDGKDYTWTGEDWDCLGGSSGGEDMALKSEAVSTIAGTLECGDAPLFFSSTSQTFAVADGEGTQIGTLTARLRAGEPAVLSFSTEDSASEALVLSAVIIPDDPAAPEVESSVLTPTSQGVSIDGSEIEIGEDAEYTGATLSIVYEEPDEDYPDGPTDRYGTFSITWHREEEHDYSCAVEWVPPEGVEPVGKSAFLTLTLGMADGTEQEADIELACLAQAAEDARAGSLVSASLTMETHAEQMSSLPAALCIRSASGTELLFAALSTVSAEGETSFGTFAYDPETDVSVTGHADLEAGADSWTGYSDMTGACYSSSISAESDPPFPSSGYRDFAMAGANGDSSTFRLRIEAVTVDAETLAGTYQASLLWSPDEEGSTTVDGAVGATAVLSTVSGDGTESESSIEIGYPISDDEIDEIIAAFSS